MDELEVIRKKNRILEKRLSSVENSISYSLGNLLLNMFKNNNWMRLPFELISLKNELKERKKKSSTIDFFKVSLNEGASLFEYMDVKKNNAHIAVIDISEQSNIELYLSINAKKARGNQKKALIAKFSFIDDNNHIINNLEIENLQHSAKTGLYKYIEVLPGYIMDNTFITSLNLPDNVKKCIVEISAWQGLDIKIRNHIKVKKNKTSIKENIIRSILVDTNMVKTSSLMLKKDKPYQIHIPMTFKKRYELKCITDGRNSRGNEKNAIIAKFRFLDKDNNLIEATKINGLSKSEKIGFYKYIDTLHEKITETTIALFRPPTNTTICEVSFVPWKGLDVQLLNHLTLIEHSAWEVDGFLIPEPNNLDDNLQIASICDTFTEFSLKFDLNLTPLSRTSWLEQLDNNKFKLLLVESAWNGNDGDWKYALTNPEGKAFSELKKVVKEFKKRNIKTIFYNKEDSPNYDIFIHVAKLFDIVVTSDINCVEMYKKDCKHNNIYVMPFAAQPKIHNPIGKSESDDLDIAFAGTWYKNKHKDRSEQMPILLNPSSEYKLKIFNRQSDWTIDDSYTFPDRYQPFLNDKVAYEEMLSIHKMFKILLNTNSVNDSNSMFSRRVFEVLASSTPIVSTESSGVRKMFKDIVPVVKNEREATIAIKKLMKDDLYRKKIGHIGHREVMLNHTVKHRFSKLFKEIGLEYAEDKLPKVTMAIPTNRVENLSYIKENILRQNYTNLEAVIVLNNDNFKLLDVKKYFSDISWVKVIQLPENATLGACLNASVKNATGKYWSKMDDDNIYLENFISDMMLPFKYSDYKIVIKSTYYAYLEGSKKLILRFPNREHKVVDFGSGSALIVDISLFKLAKFPDVSIGEDTQWMKTCEDLGYKMYSTDCFNYVVMRRTDINSHTWKVDDSVVMKGSIEVSNKLDLKIVSV